MVVLAIVVVADAPEAAVDDEGLIMLAAVDAADDVCGMVGAGDGSPVGSNATSVSSTGVHVPLHWRSI